MYHLATCRASIYRGTVPGEFGEPTASPMPIRTNVLASITERAVQVQDNATQTPRISRTVGGFFPYGTDILPNDRVTDDSHGISYKVLSVTVTRVAAIRPDITVELTRIGPT